MRLGRLLGSAIVFVPLFLICASRVHAQRSANPNGMTQEVNRCLTVMRVAASRRKTAHQTSQRERFSSRVSSDAAGTFGRPRSSAKSA